jgi:hypothetical protein
MDVNTNQNSIVFKALESVMRPLIRLMLARGITYVIFTDWLKRVYVETALQDFSLSNKVTNDSRISVLTGVHRKDVRRLRETLLDHKSITIPANVNLGSQLVSAWLTNPKFMLNNIPAKIPRLKKYGGEISFEALAELITKDVRARALLDELERLGAVSIDEDDMVSLATDAFIPSKGEEEKTFYLGLGVGDHTCAAVNNVLGMHPTFFDRVLHYDQLPDSSIQKIEALSREHSSHLLQLINKETESLNQATQNSLENKKRFSLGIYFYHEDIKNSEHE